MFLILITQTIRHVAMIVHVWWPGVSGLQSFDGAAGSLWFFAPSCQQIVGYLGDVEHG